MKDKAKWLAKHYQDVAEGGKSQYTHGDGWLDTEWGPCFHSIEYQWRVVMPPKDFHFSEVSHSNDEQGEL